MGKRRLRGCGQFARDALAAEGMSCAELARRLGITPSAVIQLLHGENMQEVTFHRIMAALGYHVELIATKGRAADRRIVGWFGEVTR